MRANEDGVDAHLIADMIGNGPLRHLKLLPDVAYLGAARDGATRETVVAALVCATIRHGALPWCGGRCWTSS